MRPLATTRLNRHLRLPGFGLQPSAAVLVVFVLAFALPGLTGHSPWKTDDAIGIVEACDGLPLPDGREHHIATHHQGDFIGEMSFLDGAARSADAVAFTDTELYALSRRRFDEFSSQHKRVAINLFEGIARMLALRMRFTNAELRLLQVS